MEQILIETISRLVKDLELNKNNWRGFVKEKSCLTNQTTFCDDPLFKRGETSECHLDLFDVASCGILIASEFMDNPGLGRRDHARGHCSYGDTSTNWRVSKL